MRLSDFQVLTFDCYGTLIDWDGGRITALQPLLAAAPGLSPAAALDLLTKHERDQQQQTPDMLYSELLAVVHRRLAKELAVPMPEDAHRRFGQSIPDWPAFPDTPAALQYLKQHYQLMILSNVDRASFAASNQRLGVEFDAIYTAQDIGSYKPDLANFRYMLDHLRQRGFEKSAILHTAQSLFHDHGPARQIGLHSAWIDRRNQLGSPAMPTGQFSYDVRFTTLAEMVQAHQAEQTPP